MNWKRKFLVFSFLLIIIIFLIVFLYGKNKFKFTDTIIYEDDRYVLLEYNMDIFTYNYNGNFYIEEDTIYPIKHNKWKMIYFSGDLFVLDEQVDKATKYYSSDNNYEWFIVFDDEDYEEKKFISINSDDLDYLYNIEDIKYEKTIVFSDIDRFCDLIKISEDNTVQGVVLLAQVDGVWYYKTEVMTDDDREYVIKLTDELNSKINDLLK